MFRPNKKKEERTLFWYFFSRCSRRNLSALDTLPVNSRWCQGHGGSLNFRSFPGCQLLQLFGYKLSLYSWPVLWKLPIGLHENCMTSPTPSSIRVIDLQEDSFSEYFARRAYALTFSTWVSFFEELKQSSYDPQMLALFICFYFILLYFFIFPQNNTLNSDEILNNCFLQHPKMIIF